MTTSDNNAKSGRAETAAGVATSGEMVFGEPTCPKIGELGNVAHALQRL